ncbi:MAG: alcohol dehydrogenase catalytic domain-containing protein [Ancrocorticia sp.]|nr:alcohol dehydrogenase catalytic domain-containing protein [Ancrocorticia sp.]
MRAWRFEKVEQGLFLADIPAPVPQAEQVVINVKAAGLCHTDVGTIAGALIPPVLPMTLGHEIFGTIASMGSEVNGWRLGQRVVVASNPTFGGDAEQVAVDSSRVVAVPDVVDDAVAASAADAGITAYHALHAQGGVSSGMEVGIIGLGGIGGPAAQMAVNVGANVYIAEIKQSLSTYADQLGVAGFASTLASFPDVAFDLILDCAGDDTTSQAFSAIAPGGRIVQVGTNQTKAKIDLLDVLWKEPQYLGSNTGTNEDLSNYLDLVAQGGVTPLIERIGFEDIPEGLDRLARGSVSGRLVAVL